MRSSCFSVSGEFGFGTGGLFDEPLKKRTEMIKPITIYLTPHLKHFH